MYQVNGEVYDLDNETAELLDDLEGIGDEDGYVKSKITIHIIQVNKQAQEVQEVQAFVYLCDIPITTNDEIIPNHS